MSHLTQKAWKKLRCVKMAMVSSQKSADCPYYLNSLHHIKIQLWLKTPHSTSCFGCVLIKARRNSTQWMRNSQILLSSPLFNFHSPADIWTHCYEQQRIQALGGAPGQSCSRLSQIQLDNDDWALHTSPQASFPIAQSSGNAAQGDSQMQCRRWPALKLPLQDKKGKSASQRDRGDGF